jgi:ABC-type branched-subunit amino acid transport system substrate-binding protein
MLVLVALLAAGCGRGGDDDGGGEGGDLASAPGFDGKTFKMGVITVTSGPVAGAAQPSLDGIRTYVKSLNDKGGIAGKYPVELVIRDMQYDPAKTVQAYNATKNDVAMYAQVFGTPMTKAILPQLEADKIIVVPGSFDGSFVREQQIVLASTPYESQIINGIHYLRSQPGGEGKRVCGAGQEGALAETVGRVLDYARDEMDVEVGRLVTLPATASGLTPQVQQLRRDGCDLVVVLATPVPATSNVLSTAARLRFEPQWITTNTGFVAALKDSPVFDYMKEHFLQVSDGTTWGDTEHAPAMRDVMAAHDKYTRSTLPEWAFVNGWVGMMQLDQILRKAVENGDVSREGILEAMNSLSELDVKGLQFNWTWGPPDRRKPPARYSIFAPDAESVTGVTVKEYGLDSPPASIEYPYE